ncbi:hypothetical protein GCM10009557_42490 [Virgisporangium ochraceum]|uniref:Uncharacterized protein n=1 Tax=Virgisporangium ochraceum TaxID=65505 RepID=A0A8J4EHR9_9ACTN|nr:hypothetical protein Voc01_101960 [Virgisporangium ochraceum]
MRCTTCEPWCTAQLKKIEAVANPSGLFRHCRDCHNPRAIAYEIARYAARTTALANAVSCHQ